jgi:hypothetical protein
MPYKNMVVSWFDFSSKSQIFNLAKLLERNPPKGILIGRLPEEVFKAHEDLFNYGKSSSQREIIKVIDKLIQERKIYLVKKIEIDGILLELYVRDSHLIF